MTEVMNALRSALIIEVPEAEPVVGPARLKLDRVAALGVPAHVTVLFPFMGAEQIDEEALARVEVISSRCPSFDYAFSRSAWFGDDVLFLAPDDPGPFRRLTERLAAAFPDWPPYGGAYADVIPHLTIGEGGDPHAMRTAEKTVLSHGPIRGQARRLSLMIENPDAHWNCLGWFELGRASGFHPSAAPGSGSPT